MKVKRYDIQHGLDGYMEEYEYGDYVRYEDYVELLKFVETMQSELLPQLHRHVAYKDGYDTGTMHAAPKQQAVEVTEEMVHLALDAYNASRGTYSGEVPTDRDDIRSALLAALTGKTEVDRG